MKESELMWEMKSCRPEWDRQPSERVTPTYYGVIDSVDVKLIMALYKW